MSAYTDELRRTALAECHHGADELCEHRSAALAYQVIEQGPGVRFDMGALLCWMALTAAFAYLAFSVLRWLL